MAFKDIRLSANQDTEILLINIENYYEALRAAHKDLNGKRRAFRSLVIMKLTTHIRVRLGKCTQDRVCFN
jgi:hypothetical protein